MQPEVYYFKLIPKRLILHKSIIYSVHPLTKFRILLLRNSQLSDSMKEWMYAGHHNGSIDIQSTPLQMVIDTRARTNFFTLKLMRIKYSLSKDDGVVVNNVQKQQLVGKHNLFIKNYISKFKFENIHFFEQQAHISADFILHYEVFVQKTPQGLNKIVLQHQRLNLQNRPRRGSQVESVQSSAFSDKINGIEIKGQNRFASNASELMKGPLIGSDTKLDMANVSSLNMKMNKIKRSNNPHQQLFKGKLFNIPSTQKKSRQNENEQQQYQNEQQMVSPVFSPLDLKKLSSQQIRVNFEMFSPRKLSKKKLPQEKTQTNQEKKRKLLEQFQRKRLQFKRKLNQTKELGQVLPAPLTDRALRRSSSTRSMRSVRLTELQKLPQQKPWVKKEKQKAKVRNKKIMYILIVVMIVLLYIAMKPNKNVEVHQFQQKYESKMKIKPEKKVKQKRERTIIKK